MGFCDTLFYGRVQKCHSYYKLHRVLVRSDCFS